MSLLFGHSVWRIARVLFIGLGAGWALGLADNCAQAAPIEIHRAVNIAQWFTWPRYEASGAGIAWPPYKNEPRPPNAAELEALRQAGFDSVRLPVDPAPYMVFQGNRREAVYEMLFDAIERIRSAGLKVIVDLHPNSRHAVWGQNAIVAGLESPTFVTFSKAVGDIAAQLSRFDSEEVALELINEPRLKCDGADQALWQRMLKTLVARARSANPNMTLIVTGSCISTPDGLMALDPQPLADKNLIYTFHYYEPFTFTHQGAKFIPWPDKYLDAVPWPASARPIDQPMALLDENMKKVPDLNFAARQIALAGARNNLKKFYASGAGPDLIEARFAAVADWAKQHGIPTNRVFIGEFGVLRREPETRGARCEDRMRWLSDVRRIAEGHGFSWSYFNYDGPFALTVSDGNRQLDPAVLASLGLAEQTDTPC